MRVSSLFWISTSHLSRISLGLRTQTQPSRRHSFFSTLSRIPMKKRRRFSFPSMRFSTTASNDEPSLSAPPPPPPPPKKVAIIGGGLAGLSTAFHLLDKSQKGLDLTIFDMGEVGTRGASSVAGGFVHPISPRGNKLVHWGLEGLRESDRLIGEACKHVEEQDTVVLRDELYRLAVTPEHANQLQKAADNYPDIAQWLSSAEIQSISPSSKGFVGGLRLYNGCKVIHVPSYLKGLWGACVSRAAEKDSDVAWTVTKSSSAGADDDWKERLNAFDAVVLAAGAGMFGSSSLASFCSADVLPIHLVGGQSVELRLSDSEVAPFQHALFCGKYVAPLPEKGLVLVGATQEFSTELMLEEKAVAHLKEQTIGMAPEIWLDCNSNVERVTRGVRVQSERGKYGRRPLIGRLPGSPIHPNSWLFTGLSSRGLLYHGLYGNLLSEAILSGSEDLLLSRCKDILWWRGYRDILQGMG